MLEHGVVQWCQASKLHTTRDQKLLKRVPQHWSKKRRSPIRRSRKRSSNIWRGRRSGVVFGRFFCCMTIDRGRGRPRQHARNCNGRCHCCLKLWRRNTHLSIFDIDCWNNTGFTTVIVYVILRTMITFERLRRKERWKYTKAHQN